MSKASKKREMSYLKNYRENKKKTSGKKPRKAPDLPCKPVKGIREKETR